MPTLSPPADPDTAEAPASSAHGATGVVGRVALHLLENDAPDGDTPFTLLSTVRVADATVPATDPEEGADPPPPKPRHVLLRDRVLRLAAEDDLDGIAKLIDPLRKAGAELEEFRRLVADRSIYGALQRTPEQALTLLEAVPTLRDAGLDVHTPPWWPDRSAPRVAVTLDDADADPDPDPDNADGAEDDVLDDADRRLTFDAHVAYGDEPLDTDDIEALLAGPEGLVRFNGEWAVVDHRKLKAARRQMQELRARARDSVSFGEGMRMLAGLGEGVGAGGKGGDGGDDDYGAVWIHATAGDTFRDTLAALRDPSRISPVEAEGLNAELRHYQADGAAWLRFVTGLGLGACLADDMGLGKTLQVLAALNADAKEHAARAEAATAGKGRKKTARRKTRPTLLVVPASLMHNWENEAAKFTPDLRVELLHPQIIGRDAVARRERQAEKTPRTAFRDVDLVVTTYAMTVRLPWLALVPWHRVILDESQAIKNPGTKQTRAVKKLRAPARIALTGTPIENRLTDLWSLFDFLNPGLLGSRADFKRLLDRLDDTEPLPGMGPDEKAAMLADAYAPLRRLVGPYILRRTKTDRSVITDLPDKTEQHAYCTLTPAQTRLYEKTVADLQASLDNTEGIQRKGAVLQTLMRLKQICNHPDQLKGARSDAYSAERSGKFLRLTELAEQLADANERVLVFTQFREIMDPLSDLLGGVFGRDGEQIHGSVKVPQRARIVERFQQPGGPPFLVLSLKAAGVGLNLTAAAQVIHFDRWWNPAVEDQATDRAFRIGQKRNVLVHKFVTRGTVEEKIDRMIHDKKQLAAALLPAGGDGEAKLTELDDNQLMDLVRLDAHAAAL